MCVVEKEWCIWLVVILFRNIRDAFFAILFIFVFTTVVSRVFVVFGKGNDSLYGNDGLLYDVKIIKLYRYEKYVFVRFQGFRPQG